MGKWETGQKTGRGKEKKVTLQKACLLLQQKQVVVVCHIRKALSLISTVFIYFRVARPETEELPSPCLRDFHCLLPLVTIIS